MTDTFSGVEGQEPAIGTLRAAIERDRLASAYLFEGPSGVGKALTVRALAKAVMGRVPARSGAWADADELARRIEHGAHPDVRVFPPRDEGNRNLPVETVREQVLPFAQFAPFEAGAAFVVFPDADVSFPEQHPEAANAMLKTLEEPRPNVTFVLLSSRPDRLLQTIRSRCQRVRFRRLSDALLHRILESRGVPSATRAVAVALADGRADKALMLSEAREDGTTTADALFDLALRVDQAAEDGRPGRVVTMAEELAKFGDLPGAIEALMAFYRDVTRAALGLPDDALAFSHHAAALRARAQVFHARHGAEAVAGLRELEEMIAGNVTKETAIADWLFSIGREPMPPRARRRVR